MDFQLTSISIKSRLIGLGQHKVSFHTLHFNNVQQHKICSNIQFLTSEYVVKTITLSNLSNINGTIWPPTQCHIFLLNRLYFSDDILTAPGLLHDGDWLI